MRKVFASLTILAALILTYTVYDHNRYSKHRLDAALSIGNQTVLEVKGHLDSIFWQSKISADSLARKITASNLDEDALKKIIRKETDKHPHLLGITVAFEPFKINKDKELFSLFYNKIKRGFSAIETTYNYRDTTLATARWYTRAASRQAPILTDPYFGEAAGELITDYSVPLFRKKGGQKEFVGVLTYSLSLDQFTEVVNSYIKGNSGYVFLLNQKGDFITHPNRSFILKKSIFEVVNNPEYAKTLANTLVNTAGHFRFVSVYTQVPSILFYNTTALTNWKIFVVYSYADLIGNPKKLERKITNIGMAASLFILFLLVTLLKLYEKKTRHLWQLSAIISILFILNIALFWVLHLDLDYSEELANRTRVYSSNALTSYVHKKNYEQQLLGKERYIEVPTGIFIEELLVTDSYNMSMSGKVWQKWPADHDLKDKIGFHFPQASPLGRSVFVELLSKDRLDSATWLYTWKFHATLRVFFDYNHYPLDQHYIDIKIIYPDVTDNIILIPDFDSYRVLNPSSKPGMSNIIFLTRHRIIASYFSFSSIDMKTYFGQDTGSTSPEYNALEYNIVIKRRFITPFISFVIPFLIGAAIIFFLLYSLNKNKDQYDNSGVTVMGVVQGMAALFFSMLLAHITIRNRIPTPHITYLEAFYFVIYVLIVLLILIVVIYSRSSTNRLLNYKDNLIVKVVYWPLLIGMIYLITFIKFY